MTDIKQFMMNIFEKYNIYNKSQFLAVTIYVIQALTNDMIQYENEYQYCIQFYIILFGSVPYDSIPTDLLNKLFKSRQDNNFTPITIQQLDTQLPQPSSNFGQLVDTLFVLISKHVLRPEDFELPINGLNVNIESPTNVTINGVSSTTIRGCIWKLLYLNIIYKLSNI